MKQATRDSLLARRGRAPTAMIGAILVAGLAACAPAPNGTGASKPVDSAAAADYVATANRITENARTGLVYSPTNEFTPADQLRVMTTWLGPAQSPSVPAGKSIAFVSCGATVCNETAAAGAQVAQQAGFRSSVVNENGTADIQNINQAMASAIALRPDAIVGVCVTATQIADKLEQARAAGILTVSTCDPTPAGGPGQFDAAADYANGLSAELLGWGIVSGTKGDANVVAIKDEAFPAVVRKIGNLERVLRDCPSCTVSTVTWQVTDAANSAKAANILTGIINANPQMNVLVLPYSIGMPSAVQAVASSGRDIKIYADDLDAVNNQMLRDGSIEMVSSVDPRLAMYQCIDQVNRGLGGGGYVQPAHLPYLAHLYTKDNLPDTGVGAFTRLFDYDAVYRDMWKKP
jgi:ABC-type sugar transport system substrate-binding protein